jgi:pantoate--beta-alanine ligase
VIIPHALGAAADAYAAGERGSSVLRGVACDVLATEPGARTEYVDVIDADTLEPVDRIDRPAVIATAVWFGEVRLIDNRLLG